jgi:hypothetical protein
VGTIGDITNLRELRLMAGGGRIASRLDFRLAALGFRFNTCSGGPFHCIQGSRQGIVAGLVSALKLAGERSLSETL